MTTTPTNRTKWMYPLRPSERRQPRPTAAALAALPRSPRPHRPIAVANRWSYVDAGQSMPDIIVFALQEVVSLNPVNIAVGSTFMVRKREGGEGRGGRDEVTRARA